MCGIFGLIKQNPKDIQSIKDDINDLFMLTEPRGRQASGISLLTNGCINVYKRPATAGTLIKQDGFKDFLNSCLNEKDDYVAFIGHCRLVTDGTELNPDNNQPIQTEGLSGVHNGVINNSSSIAEKLSIETIGHSDSVILFRAFQSEMAQTDDPHKAHVNIYSKIRGSASLGILYANYPQMSISTNFGSLYYSTYENDYFVFASEAKILKSFFTKRNIFILPKQLRPGEGLSVSFTTLDLKHFSLSPGLSSVKNPKVGEDKMAIVDKSPSSSNIKRCVKCVLPITYPFIKFNEHGICNFCEKYEKQKFKGKEELERYLEKYRSKTGAIDCLVGLSGGRDSSFALHLLKKELGMNPVGFCYDWLLTSRKARHNVAKMAGALGVEVIYRCGDYQTQANNIRNNIYGFLKDPDLGMMTFVQAGDKEMYHYGRKIRKEIGVDLTVWGSGYQLEQREFFVGYCGINKTLRNNPRLYGYGWTTKIRLALYYAMKTVKNPGYWNSSIYYNALAFWHCFVAKDDFLYLYDYYPWDEQQVERVLKEQYLWESDNVYGKNQWRMDDFHTSFINYVYYTIGGFSEFDEFRSNQIREGLITRSEALVLIKRDNEMRYESLREFSNLVGFNLEHVLTKIEMIPKLY